MLTHWFSVTLRLNVTFANIVAITFVLFHLDLLHEYAKLLDLIMYITFLLWMYCWRILVDFKNANLSWLSGGSFCTKINHHWSYSSSFILIFSIHWLLKHVYIDSSFWSKGFDLCMFWWGWNGPWKSSAYLLLTLLHVSGPEFSLYFLNTDVKVIACLSIVLVVFEHVASKPCIFKIYKEFRVTRAFWSFIGVIRNC